MWGSLVLGLMARPWALRVAALALVALTVTLFIVNLRRTAEHAGRASEIPYWGSARITTVVN